MLTVCIRIWEDREKHMQRRLGDLTLASPSSLSACSTTHHRPPPPPTTHHFVYPYPHPRRHILDGKPEFLEPSLGGIMGTRHTPKEQNGSGFGRTSPPPPGTPNGVQKHLVHKVHTRTYMLVRAGGEMVRDGTDRMWMVDG